MNRDDRPPTDWPAQEIVVCAYGDVPIQHLQTVHELAKRPPHYVHHISDVALARALALAYCSRLAGWAEYVLMLDVDIVATGADVIALRDALDAHPDAGLAVCDYDLRDGSRALQLGPHHGRDPRWVLCGLGCAMVRTAVLNEVPVIRAGYELVPAVVGSGQHPELPGIWMSEDHWMCWELGAVSSGRTVEHLGARGRRCTG